MRLADYIIYRLEEFGVKHIFMITGGGAMHLNDAVGRSKKIRYVCNHHEQATAIAAEGYSRYNYELGVSVVTSGPGGTNTLTGVIGQWLDSIPGLYLSGQVKWETTIGSCPELGLRQLGDQELNIVEVVKPITKYAVQITDPKEIRKELELALYLATNGRPGPVWLDIPLNVQGANVIPEELAPWDGKLPEKDEKSRNSLNKNLTNEVAQLVGMIENSQRPVIIAGHGIKIGGAENAFLKLIDKAQIPVLTTFNGFDLVDFNHPNFIGRIGTLGTRAGNFALQNADLVISIGSRNNIRQVSYNWGCFARSAKVVLIDIDEAELQKKTLQGELCIHADANSFIDALLSIPGSWMGKFNEWNNWCRERKQRYPSVLSKYNTLPKIHPYPFMQKLTQLLPANSTIVAANGSACVTLFQAGEPKPGQRIFWNSGCASMGYDLPAAIGAAFASNDEVICVAGDGSIMMNLQELQTISHYKLPIKIFLLNNLGYQSIKQTQGNFFNGHFVGCTLDSGLSFPNFEKLADAHSLPYAILEKRESFEHDLKNVLAMKGPVFCEVILDTEYIFSPKVSSKKLESGKMISKPLEDMFPFLDREEFLENMIVPPLEEEDV